MKMLSTGRVSLLGVVLASVSISDAARETMSVTEGGITFIVARYDDDRNKPYRLKFSQDGTRSLYMFDSATHVTGIKVGTERYKMLYDTADNLESVELASSTRRALAEEEEENDAAAVEGRRLEFSDCTECADAWDSLCAGSSSVCNLVDYGSPFSATAAASIDTMCETFGSACSSYEASEACQDQCTDEESSINPCLDPTREDYKCTFSEDASISLTACDLVDTDVAFLPACFEEFGKTNIERLFLNDNYNVTSYPEGIFSGLSELRSLGIYSNGLATVPDGLFSGLTKLEFLDIASNDLATLPEGIFSDLTNLNRLYLSGNDLTDMTSLEGLFDGLTELTELRLSDNGLTTLPGALFAGLTKLEILILRSNGLSALPDGVFSDLAALSTLDLTDNDLTNLGAELSGLMELRRLLLENNDLLLTEDVFSGLVNLEELNLVECGLTTLPASVFSPMENLEQLELVDNEDLQCLPSTTATVVDLDFEDIRDGMCECTPVDAVFCDDGLSCESGLSGYACVAE